MESKAHAHVVPSRVDLPIGAVLEELVPLSQGHRVQVVQVLTVRQCFGIRTGLKGEKSIHIFPTLIMRKKHEDQANLMFFCEFTGA